jgi:two-component system, chemotaxis family, chemotaxis protein CheY
VFCRHEAESALQQCLQVQGKEQMPMEPQSPINVLVVDDSATMRRMVMVSLRELTGVKFFEAGNGLEAIERLAIAPIDLILLDLNMPDMHGMEVVRFVKAHNAYRSIPVVVLTTRGDEDTRGAALAAGASLYLTKPFEPGTLVGHAKNLLQLE